jgi:hypothetical protein
MRWVNVYSVNRLYGGPEEGGWWYDTGEIVLSKQFDDDDSAQDYAESLEKQFPNTGKRYSVLGGEDYNIWVEDSPGQDYPTERPRYE